MRIWQICADRGIAPDSSKGASVHLRALAGAWTELGHRVETFTARRSTGEDVFPVALNRLTEGALLGRIHASGLPDVVYERYSLGSTTGLEFARSIDRPFALEVNSPLVYEARKHRSASLTDEHIDIEHHLWRNADLVFSVSEPLRRHIVQVRGTERGVVVLPNGCEPSLYEPETEQREETTLVFLGHPKPWHGASMLAPLVASLTRWGLDARLLLIGGGPGADEVMAAANELGVGDRIDVTGGLSRAEAAAELQRASIALAPYPVHDFFYFCPLKVIEYMAAGLPVVASAQGDIPRLLGDCGVLVPPGDFDAFLRSTTALLADPDRRHELGHRARRRALRHYTWRGVATSVVESVNALELVAS